jgi:ligand-binding sensor domain-containing protein/serine phosphatase RsbU (regulator of sigma subunit)
MRKLLLIIFIVVSAFGFSQEYKFNVFGQEEGLPQPYVYDIIQAKNGFLYVATGDGLASYGGDRFNKFSKRVGLSENFCNSLFSDSKQRIWIGHFEGGVTCYENGIFRKIKTSAAQAAKVISFAEDSKHNIYYTNSAGSIYNVTGDSITPFIVEELPPANKIKIKDNLLFIASQEGLLVMDLSTGSKDYKVIGNTKDKNVTSFEFVNNEIYAGIDEVGVELIRRDNKNFTTITTYSTELKSKRLNIKDVCFKNGNELWVSLTNEGLSVLKFNNDREIDRQLTISAKNGLKSLFISKLFVDKEQNLWLGSIGSGLFQFISDRFELFNKNNFLKFDNAITVAVDDLSNVYITDETQLNVFNPKDSSNVLLKVSQSQEEVIRCSYLNSASKELWLGTNSNLFVYDITNGKPKLKSQLNDFKGKTINYIRKDNLGQTLVCTIEGLFYLNEKNATVKTFNTDNGAPHNNFTSLFVDQIDRYWIFSPMTPLYNMFNGEISLEKDLDSSVSFRFNGAIIDNNDLVWFSTEGDGVFTYSKNRKPKYVRFTSAKGLASDYIYGIITTNNGDVITCHKNGISIKYKSLKTFRAINKNSGLPANNINNNAICKDKNGYIWLGTTEGVIKYSPLQDHINSIPPSVSIKNLTFNDSIQNPTDTLFELEYGKYELVIDAIGVSLTNPKGVTYRYQLEGFEDKFRETDNGKIVYPSLSDGEYRFVLHARNDDGFETQKPLTFRVVINQPIWKNIWFYIIIIGAALIGFYFFVKARTKKLQQDKERLELMVNEKTKELVVEKERVEKANELLHEKNQDITDSITYAKRIQTAVLPHMEFIHKYLDLFVLYKPRDIVSGDFYWCYVTNKYIYVAVVDCTGHGVPGAFMSLLGSTYLDQVLIEMKEPMPKEVLNGLDRKINQAFKQSNPDHKIGDGMDMCLCRMDKEMTSIVIASANRPIYYFTNNELIETKANIYSIGGMFDGIDKNFTEVTYSINKGDRFYMFSDGYGDQFGGEKNRRFSTRKMKTIFTEIQNEHVSKQNQILEEEYENWRGENEQIDDVCVIGIKF